MSIYWIPRNNIAKACVREEIVITGTVLDFGCGSMPYAKYFNGCHEYIGIEYDRGLPSGSTYSKDKVIYYAGLSLPFPDNSFDSIVSFQVLEHVQDFGQTIQELCRVAKPGACFLLTVPLLWPEHETPFDYRRFTRWSAEQFLDDAGLIPVKLYPLGSIYDVIIMFILDYLDTHASSFARLLAQRLAPSLNLLSRVLNRIDTYSNRVDRYCYLDLCILAKKRS